MPCVSDAPRNPSKIPASFTGQSWLRRLSLRSRRRAGFANVHAPSQNNRNPQKQVVRDKLMHKDRCIGDG